MTRKTVVPIKPAAQLKRAAPKKTATAHATRRDRYFEVDTSKSAAEGRRKASRGDFVRASIRQAIEEGQFKPGDRMRENEIAEWLKVSRTPVREALRLLETEGLVVFEPWRGVVVASLDRHQIVELYEVRAALEGLAAGIAAKYMNDNELQLLGDLIDKCEAATDPLEAAKLNRRFHEAIYIGAHNRFLMQNLSGLRSSTALLRGTTYAVPGRMDEVKAEHRAIYDAIRRHDEAAASAAAAVHLRQAELARLKSVSDD